uniref:ATP synthase complex subunit 8 n=1 Tax=Perimede sp. MJT-2014 TaxID=1498837 RepID=A0A076E856_9NEOP|nr:ATP synthase F0 subunit 8 [Perimede sp. MJT-2014]
MPQMMPINWIFSFFFFLFIFFFFNIMNYYIFMIYSKKNSLNKKNYLKNLYWKW